MKSELLVVFAAALATAMAWLVPNTLGCALLGWLGAIGVAYGAANRFSMKGWYLFGVIVYAIGFYWLFPTIRDFSGLPVLAAAGIYALFFVVSALQFVVFGWLLRLTGRGALGTALAWTASELLPFRIFPWQLGHTQISLLPLVQVAEFGGSILISFLVLYGAGAAVTLALHPNERSSRWSAGLAGLLLTLAVIFGSFAISEEESEHTVPVALVQANLSTVEREDIKLFLKNTDRYIELTKRVSKQPTLIVWPESVVLDPIPTFRRQLSDDPNLQGISGGNPIILGALTYDTNRKIYNSALGVQPDGTILPPYHKRVLMPFGEYTPMAEIFPFLKEMNASVGDFSAGTGPAVFGLKLQAGLEATLSVAPLICYEEVQPQFAAESVRSGAHLLVGLSNDAWFGDTAAPHQHHMIAAFRAIENRRSFVRSTNSGLSALIDPFGRTVATLPTFGEGVLEARLPLEDRLTIYTRYGNDLYWLIPLGILVLLRSLRTRTNSPYP